MVIWPLLRGQTYALPSRQCRDTLSCIQEDAENKNTSRQWGRTEKTSLMSEISLPNCKLQETQEPLSGGFDQPFPNANQLQLTLELISSRLEKLSQRLPRQVGLRLQDLLISEIGIGLHHGIGALHFLGGWGHGATSEQCRRHWKDCHLSCSRRGRCMGCTLKPLLWLRWFPRVPASPWLVIKHGYSKVSYILVARVRLWHEILMHSTMPRSTASLVMATVLKLLSNSKGTMRANSSDTGRLVPVTSEQLVCRSCLTSLVRFIPKYFVPFYAIIN